MSRCFVCGGPHKASEKIECAQKGIERGRAYYKQNRQQIRERQRAYDQTPHAKALRQRNNQKPQKREQKQNYNRRYYQQHREKLLEAQKLYYQERGRARYLERRHDSAFVEHERSRSLEYHLVRDKQPGVRERIQEYQRGYRKRPEARQRMKIQSRAKRRARGIEPRSKTKTELQMEFLLADNFPSDWKYTGQGDVTLGGCSPDFFNVNGKKALIEVYGCYWHRCPICGPPIWAHANPERDAKRLRMFEEMGYKTLVVWEHELRDRNTAVHKVKEAFYP